MSDIDVEPVDSVGEDDGGGGDGTDGDGPPAGGRGQGHEHGAAPTDEASTTALPAGVEAPEYVLYGGKGGVGKTTMAAATGLASAAGGARTLVVSTDPAHSLSDTFETEIPPSPTRIREEIPLFAAEIDPEAAVDESVFGAFDGADGPDPDAAGAPFAGAGTDEGADAFADGPGGSDGANPFAAGLGGDGGMGPMGGLEGLLGGAGAMPGADEAAAMQQLLAYLDDPRFDRVVVDTAPTGHTLRLLQLPEFLDTMVGRLVRMREQFGGLMDRVTGLFGDDDSAAAAEPDLDELRDRIERLRAVLRDPERTDFRVVMVPEEMSVVESERLVRRLREFDIPVNTIVVNRVMEALDDVATVAGDDGDGDGAVAETAAGPAVDPEWVVTPSLEDCAFCQRRWQVQQRALARASDLFRSRRVERVPLLADEVRGEAALRVVAACLN
jgi:arsenite-transporting ATPase